MKEIKGIDEFLQMSMQNNMPLSVNEKRKIFDLIINLQNQLQQKENIIKNIKSQLDYLETYSSKEDVYEDMSRRLNKIESIIGDDKW